MQPVCGNYAMTQNSNNNCNNGCNNSWWFWIIILLLFSGWGNNGGFLGNNCPKPTPGPSPRVKEERYDSHSDECDSCNEVDFTN